MYEMRGKKKKRRGMKERYARRVEGGTLLNYTKYYNMQDRRLGKYGYCPDCGSPRTVMTCSCDYEDTSKDNLHSVYFAYFVECLECGFRSCAGRTKRRARKNWSERMRFKSLE